MLFYAIWPERGTLWEIPEDVLLTGTSVIPSVMWVACCFLGLQLSRRFLGHCPERHEWAFLVSLCSDYLYGLWCSDLWVRSQKSYGGCLNFRVNNHRVISKPGNLSPIWNKVYLFSVPSHPSDDVSISYRSPLPALL